MIYSDARYRAALRRARRRYRYGRGMPRWAQAAAAIAALAVLVGAPNAARVLRGITGGTTVTAPSPQAIDAIAYARHQIGRPYCWGGIGSYCPNPPYTGFDCSGLVMEAYLSAHVTIPRTSELQWAGLRHVTSPRRGDLVFFAGSDGTTTSPGHVGLVLNPAAHTMLEAYSAGFPVRVSTFGLPTSAQGDTNPVGFARPVPLTRAPAKMITAAGSYTPASWARALLRDGGYPVSACNVKAITAWQAAEGDWAAGHAWWHNPLNTTRREPGSRDEVQTQKPSVWVQGYASWGQGFAATLATLSGPDYGGIRAALHAGISAPAVAAAVSASMWGTAPFGANC